MLLQSKTFSLIIGHVIVWQYISIREAELVTDKNGVPYLRNYTAGSNRVTQAHLHAVGVIAPSHKKLVSNEIGAIVYHEAAALHPARAAAAQMGAELRAVIAGLIGATLEVFVLVEDNLHEAQMLSSLSHFIKDKLVMLTLF